MENYFSELNSVNVKDKVEKKNGLDYLSWAYAWGELKKLHPDAVSTIYHNKDDWNYFTDGKTCWVKTGVTVNGIEHIEELPVMDYKNHSIPLEKVTSTDINKAIQRSITKAIARHGLGLYLYAGEDLPEDEPKCKPNVYDNFSSDPEIRAMQEEVIALCKGSVDLANKAAKKNYGVDVWNMTREQLSTTLDKLNAKGA